MVKKNALEKMGVTRYMQGQAADNLVKNMESIALENPPYEASRKIERSKK